MQIDTLNAWNTRALLNSFTYLKRVEESRGLILNSDLSNAFVECGEILQEHEKHRHASLLLESVLRPVLNSSMSVSFKIIGPTTSPTQFFSRIINFLVTCPGGSASQNVEQLRHDATVLCGGSTPMPPGLGYRQQQKDFKAPSEVNTIDSRDYHGHAVLPLIPQIYQPNRTAQVNSAEVNDLFSIPSQQHIGKLEASEPICKFLAMLRKNGMDVLFPITHMDKVLSSIYVAVRAPDSVPLAHRELIDIVMFAKNYSDMSDCSSISKTKVRGVLALLKHAEVLVAQTVGEGLPVQLRLSHSIKNFDDIRNKLDYFLLAFSTEFDLKIPQDLWSQIVWRKSDRPTRLADVLSLIERLQAVYDCYIATESESCSVDHSQMVFNANDEQDISPMTTTDDWESHDSTPGVSRTPSLDHSSGDALSSPFLGSNFNLISIANLKFPISTTNFHPSTQLDFPAYSLWMPAVQVCQSYSQGATMQQHSFGLDELIDDVADMYSIQQAIRQLSPGADLGVKMNMQWPTDDYYRGRRVPEDHDKYELPDHYITKALLDC